MYTPGDAFVSPSLFALSAFLTRAAVDLSSGFRYLSSEPTNLSVLGGFGGPCRMRCVSTSVLIPCER